MLTYSESRRTNLNRPRVSRRHCQGFSIVELLVGVAIGLFILTGASLLYVNNLGNTRLLLIQARMDQDLRSAMDLITRDLRRGAYWADSLSDTATSTSVSASNPYTAVTVAGSASAATIAYRYDLPASTAASAPADIDERTFGFRLTSTDQAIGRIQMDIGDSDGSGNWQTITDINIVSVIDFSITSTATEIDIRRACTPVCTGSGCPSVTVRTFNIVLQGRSQIDPSIVKTLQSQVRVRNDEIAGACI